MDAYLALEEEFLRRYRLGHFAALAGWDAQVLMPEKGSDARGLALAELERLLHQLITDPKIKTLLDQAEAGKAALSPLQVANLREMRREWAMSNLLPEAFAAKKVEMTNRAQQTWQKCRAANDFAGFLPTLKELVALYREEGVLRAGDSGKAPYEALVEVYEPGFTLARLDEIFSNVKSWLPGLLKDVLERRAKDEAPPQPLQTPLCVKKQEALGKFMMKDVWKFDMDAGRLDVSAHPFCGNSKEDVRITTNYDPEHFEVSLLGVIHETGHGRYEQMCGPKEMAGQPVCNARSLGLHESQSLFAEFQVARSGAFAEFLSPKMEEYFGAQAPFAADNLRKLLQAVKPGYIRIDADEVCYPLHVILRYELERDLIEGRLEAEDVPRVWNEKMKAYLRLETEGKDNLGCLQDVHWSCGLFGYFPTYTIGAMFAAQLMATIRKELGADVVDKCIRTGEMGPIFELQKKKIWNNGCVYETEELIKRATGEALNPEHFRKHLEDRYLHQVA